jgi:hypothetical protein
VLRIRFRPLLIGYFEGLDAQRAIAWRPHDPDAKITKMKDGRTHLAHKAEQLKLWSTPKCDNEPHVAWNTNYIGFLIKECEPHLRLEPQRMRRIPRVFLSSAFVGYRFERRAVAAALTLCRLPVTMMEHFTGDAAAAFEWTKQQIRETDVVVVLLGLRGGTMPFGTPHLLAPYTYFGTEIKFAMHERKAILTYYVGRSRKWPDWNLLFDNDQERIDAATEPAGGEGYDFIQLGGFASTLTDWWLREPQSVEQLLRWVTADLTEAIWARTWRGRVLWMLLRPFGACPPGTLQLKRPWGWRRAALPLLARLVCRLVSRRRLSHVHLFREHDGFGLSIRALESEVDRRYASEPYRVP